MIPLLVQLRLFERVGALGVGVRVWVVGHGLVRIPVVVDVGWAGVVDDQVVRFGSFLEEFNNERFRPQGCCFVPVDGCQAS